MGILSKCLPASLADEKMLPLTTTPRGSRYTPLPPKTTTPNLLSVKLRPISSLFMESSTMSMFFVLLTLVLQGLASTMNTTSAVSGSWLCDSRMLLPSSISVPFRSLHLNYTSRKIHLFPCGLNVKVEF